MGKVKEAMFQEEQLDAFEQYSRGFQEGYELAMKHMMERLNELYNHREEVRSGN